MPRPTGRPQKPAAEKFHDSNMRLRDTVANNQLYREMAAALGEVPAEFARGALQLRIYLMALHEPQKVEEAVRRANRRLKEQELPPITIEDLIKAVESGTSLSLTVLKEAGQQLKGPDNNNK